MQLFHDLALNPEIPGTVSREGLEFLAEIARHLPGGAVMAETGALYGATAWVFSKNGPAGAKIYSLGPWQHRPWMDALAKDFEGCPPLSLEAFQKYTDDCKNVFPVMGLAPQALMHVNELDLFFEGSTQSNPAFAQNMSFFSKILKPGGILCGGDYAPGSPDVVQGVLKQAQGWKTPLLARGRVWAMVKPEPGGQATPDILDLMSGKGRWGAALETKKGSKYVASHDAYSGIFGFKGRISGLSFFSDDLPLDWRVRVTDANGREVELRTNDWYRNRTAEIAGLSVACQMDGVPVEGEFQCIFMRPGDGSLHHSRRQSLGKTIRRPPDTGSVLCDVRVRLDLPPAAGQGG
jgi:hypothetical protein